MTNGKHDDIFYFAKLNSIHEQLNVVGISEYEKYKTGNLSDVEGRMLLPNAEYTLSSYEKMQGVEDDGLIHYKLNSDGQRCDEFKKNHKEKHVLFAGCSFTSGEALPYKQNWSGKLHSKIGKTSGYFTVAYPGGGIDVIINNIFQYCNFYGKPDVIFLLAPESSRKFGWAIDRYYSFISPYSGPNYFDYHRGYQNAIYLAYNAIRNLEIFCKMSGISLIWSTWQGQEAKIYNTMNFENYMHMDQDDIIKSAKNYSESISPYYSMGRDKTHPGLMFSDGVANLFWEKANERNIL